MANSEKEGSKAARSIMWSGIENGGMAVLSFFILILLSRYLSPIEFGLFSVSISIIELLGLFVSMLFHDALVQRTTATDKHFNTAFSIAMILSIILFAMTSFMAPIFGKLMKNDEATYILIGCALTFPLTGLSSSIIPRQRRNLDFRNLAIRSLIGRVAGALIAIVLLFFGAGIWALVAQQLFMVGVGSLILWITTDTRPRFEIDKTAFKELIGFGGSSVASLLISFATRRIFIIISGLLLGGEASGYFNLSFRVVDMLWGVAATAVTQVALPVMSRLQHDRDELIRVYRRANELQGLLLFPCFITIAFASNQIVSLFFGEKWLAAAPYISALGVLTILQSPKLIAIPMLKASGKPNKILIGNLLELVLISAPLLLLKSLTLPIAMLIWITRESLGCFFMMIFLKYSINLSIFRQLRGIEVPLLIVILMSMLMYLTSALLPTGLSATTVLAVKLSICFLTYLASAVYLFTKYKAEFAPLLKKIFH
nr:lipopolysaccharide biosynthesis protein [uncultured Albidiferax sp.]